jgi:hypothetical protein
MNRRTNSDSKNNSFYVAAIYTFPQGRSDYFEARVSVGLGFADSLLSSLELVLGGETGSFRSFPFSCGARISVDRQTRSLHT